MKSSFLILAYTLCSLFTIAQGNKKIEIAALVKITEKADFISLSKLVAQQGYIVLDSSVLANGSFNYITKEGLLCTGLNMFLMLLQMRRVLLAVARVARLFRYIHPHPS